MTIATKLANQENTMIEDTILRNSFDGVDKQGLGSDHLWLQQGLVSRHSSANQENKYDGKKIRFWKIVLTGLTRIGFRPLQIVFQKKELPIATKNVLKKLNE